MVVESMPKFSPVSSITRTSFSLMLLPFRFVFLISRDLPTSPLFVTSSEVEMERVEAGSV